MRVTFRQPDEFLCAISARRGGGGRLIANITGENVLAYPPDRGQPGDPLVLRVHGLKVVNRMTTMVKSSNSATYSSPFTPRERAEPLEFRGASGVRKE